MTTPTVHILLATYNGEKFLREQLHSILGQTHSEWTLTVSDDGSTDGTLAIVSQFAKQVSQHVSVIKGPKRGSTYNFFHLIQNVHINNTQDLFAFCDQDDVWLEKKLTKAVHWHVKNSAHPARLYCCRTTFVNDKLSPIGLSATLVRVPSFGNALVQNIASGNTMVMSSSVIKALKKINPNHSVWHDWSAYITTTAMGGLVEFDESPYVLYRQHSNNVIGANNGLKAQISRLIPIINGRYIVWAQLTEKSIHDITDDLHPKMKGVFIEFKNLRNEALLHKRLMILARSSIRRQSFSSNLTLAIAACFKLI